MFYTLRHHDSVTFPGNANVCGQGHVHQREILENPNISEMCTVTPAFKPLPLLVQETVRSQHM